MKQVTFRDNKDDIKLVKEIERYQKKNHINSFTATVRQLCKDALRMSTIISHTK